VGLQTLGIRRVHAVWRSRHSGPHGISSSDTNVRPEADISEFRRVDDQGAPHRVVRFFFLLTVAQFERVDRKTVAWSFFATVGLGLLIELEEGATRTGYCRVTDVIPDAWGALIAMAPLMAALMTYRLWVSRSGPTISN